MDIYGWINKNCGSLKGSTVAITGATGGIGRHICDYALYLGANLVLLDRNPEKQQNLIKNLIEKYPKAEITPLNVDLADKKSVFSVCEQLEKLPINIFLHNAGAYSIPRKITQSGFDNVFEINFLAPYYIINRLLQKLKGCNGRVVVVGSIAHNYSKSNQKNPDFKGVKAASKVYGNAKRYLMFGCYELFKKETQVSLSVVHPGITFTNITAHYPKAIFWIIKNPMKIIFMKSKKAALSILMGLFKNTGYMEWIGPKYFNIWGKPSLKRLKTCEVEESEQILGSANSLLEIYKE